MTPLPHLSVAYITNRRDNRIEWALDSLFVQWTAATPRPALRLIIVDFFADDPGRRAEVAAKYARFTAAGVTTFHVTPKPTVWQGPHRLTSRDYFAASNCRNTAICLAPDGWLAYVDDLSVLMPGWLDRILAAMTATPSYIALGTYEKAKEMVVENGVLISCVHDNNGMDSRIVVARKQHAHLPELPTTIPCTGNWLFGCSLAAPITAFLAINGWDEDCDSMGAEDYPCGHMIEKAGYKFRLDPAMKTVESWELHFVEAPFLRIDKPNIHSQRDGSNAYVKMLIGGRYSAPNYFGEGGIAAVRQRVLAGEPFPITQCPDRDWRDAQLLSEM